MGIKKNLHNHLADQPTLDYDLHQGATQNLDPSYGPIEGIIVHNEEEPKKPGVWRKVGQFFKKVYSGIRNVADYVVSHRDNSNFSMPYASDQPVIKTPVSPDLNPVDLSGYLNHNVNRPPAFDEQAREYFKAAIMPTIDRDKIYKETKANIYNLAVHNWNNRPQDDITQIDKAAYFRNEAALDRKDPVIGGLFENLKGSTLPKLYALDAIHRLSKGDQRTAQDEAYYVENLDMLDKLNNLQGLADEEYNRRVEEQVNKAMGLYWQRMTQMIPGVEEAVPPPVSGLTGEIRNMGPLFGRIVPQLGDFAKKMRKTRTQKELKKLGSPYIDKNENVITSKKEIISKEILNTIKWSEESYVKDTIVGNFAPFVDKTIGKDMSIGSYGRYQPASATLKFLTKIS
jgi:hypothetical protein